MSSVEPDKLARTFLQPGALLGPRLRLEEPLLFLPDQRLWRAVDLRTHSTHAIEWLGSASEPFNQTLANRTRIIAPVHPHLQPFYRCETIEGEVYSVSGYDERLAQPSSWNVAIDEWKDFSLARRWLQTLFAAVAAWERPALPAHGAIVPSRIAGSASGSPLLTGYPSLQSGFSPTDRGFLSLQRLRNQSPEPTDDAYSLAAISYWILSLGKEPAALTSVPEWMGKIDLARREKGAAPLAWPSGAESALLSGLHEDAARRPANCSQLFANLDGFLASAESNETSAPFAASPQPPVRSSASRVLAPWRRQQLRRRQERLQRLSSERGGSDVAHVPVELLSQLKTLQADLLRTENDLARREALLANERDAFSTQKSALLRQQEGLQRQLNEIAEQRRQVEEARKAVQRQDEERQARERELEDARGILRQEEEKQAAQQTVHQQEKNRLAGEQEKLRLSIEKVATDRAALATAQAQSSEAERAVARLREEVARREQALGLIQQELTKISGTSDVRQWDFFVQQLRASRADHERRLAQLAKPESSESGARPPEIPVIGAPGKSSDLSKEGAPSAVESSQITRDDASPVRPTDLGQTVVAPPLMVAVRATLSFSTGRRLHLFGGPSLRFGRHGESDVLLVALQNGLVQTSGVNREISRKHFELKADGASVTVMDGWSDDGKPSQHGLCVDGRRVMPGGVLLRPGMMISVTTRQPGGAVPHWKVHFLSPANGSLDTGAKTHPGAIFLKRLDDAPDDVLMILSKAALSVVSAGLAPEGALVIRQGAGFAWKGPDYEEALAMGPSRFPSITVLSVGWCSPTVALTPS